MAQDDNERAARRARARQERREREPDLSNLSQIERDRRTWKRRKVFHFLEIRFDLVSLAKLVEWAAAVSGSAFSEEQRASLLLLLEDAVLRGFFGPYPRRPVWYLPESVLLSRHGLKPSNGQILEWRLQKASMAGDLWVPRSRGAEALRTLGYQVPAWLKGGITIEGELAAPAALPAPPPAPPSKKQAPKTQNKGGGSPHPMREPVADEIKRMGRKRIKSKKWLRGYIRSWVQDHIQEYTLPDSLPDDRTIRRWVRDFCPDRVPEQ